MALAPAEIFPEKTGWRRNRPPTLAICPAVDILSTTITALNLKYIKAITTMSSSITFVTSNATEERFVLKIGKPDENHTYKEYDALRALNHPCIPRVYALFSGEGRLGVMMQCMEGSTLDQSMPRKGSARARTLARQLLQAVAHAHESGIAHREISHDNIVFDGETLGLIDWNYSISRSGAPRRSYEMDRREGLLVRPEIAKSLNLSEKVMASLKLIGDVRDFSEWENRPGTSSTAASGVQERPETCGETAPTKDADRASDIGVFDSDISGRCSSAPTSPFFGESFDGYGKIEYRAAPGQEGNWYQQDAYACGLILRDLQGSADILETVANGLLAPPEERLSVSDAAAILTGEL
jgi:serine/threonine protein kinase